MAQICRWWLFTIVAQELGGEWPFNLTQTSLGGLGASVACSNTVTDSRSVCKNEIFFTSILSLFLFFPGHDKWVSHEQLDESLGSVVQIRVHHGGLWVQPKQRPLALGCCLWPWPLLHHQLNINFLGSLAFFCFLPYRQSWQSNLIYRKFSYSIGRLQ